MIQIISREIAGVQMVMWMVVSKIKAYFKKKRAIRAFTGAELRESLVQQALHVWASGVDARKDADTITHMFASVGWQWHLDQESGGRYDEDVRRRTPHLEYCGIFVGYCGQLVGHRLADDQCLPVTLRHGIAKYVLPSTYRADTPSYWQQAGAPEPRPVSADDIQRGDIVTVVTGAHKRYGDHYAIVVERDGDILHTVEGNAHGELGGEYEGTQGRGVVRTERALADVRRVYRLDERHFIQDHID